MVPMFIFLTNARIKKGLSSVREKVKDSSHKCEITTRKYRILNIWEGLKCETKIRKRIGLAKEAF